MMDFKQYIANVPDFPIKDVLFRDITPLMANGEAFSAACQEIIAFAKAKGADIVAGPESRGFIFGCPVAAELKIGFIPIRKPENYREKQFRKHINWNTEPTLYACIRMP